MAERKRDRLLRPFRTAKSTNLELPSTCVSASLPDRSIPVQNLSQEPSDARHENSHVLSRYNLWNTALERLGKEEREVLTAGNTRSELEVIQNLYEDAVQQKEECDQKKLSIDFRGRQYKLQDIADNIVVCIDKFKEIGDVAVNFDPVHAALPWAGVRILLQTAVVEMKQRFAILTGVEKIASIIIRCRIYELLYLGGQTLDEADYNLQTSLVNIYALVFSFLVSTKNLYNKGFVSRTAHGLIHPDEAFAFVEKCEKLEVVIAENARICESYSARDAESRDSGRHEDLKSSLMTLEQHLHHLDFRIGSFLNEVEITKQAEILRWISPLSYKDSHLTACVEQRGQEIGFSITKISISGANQKIREYYGFTGRITGAGKTKLVSTVIDNVSEVPEEQLKDEALAYFYCDRNRDDYQDPISILRSFVRQLSCPRRGGKLNPLTVEIYKSKSGDGFASNELDYREVQTLLQRLVADNLRTIFILDALDECNKETRLSLMSYLNSLVRQASRTVKIFVSSRPDPDIRIELEGKTSMEITAAENRDDIALYINDVIAGTDSPHYWRHVISRQMKTQVMAKLTENAEGMFQWVYLQIRELHMLSRERDIELRLGKLPQTLKETYHEIFKRIQGQRGSAPEIAKRAFQWVMCSQEPLNPRMLVAAACQDATTNQVDSVDIGIDFVLEACQSLIIIDSSGTFCKFSHLSVQEYLESDQFSTGACHSLVAKVCLVFLSDPFRRAHMTGITETSEGSCEELWEDDISRGKLTKKDLLSAKLLGSKTINEPDGNSSSLVAHSRALMRPSRRVSKYVNNY